MKMMTHKRCVCLWNISIKCSLLLMRKKVSGPLRSYRHGLKPENTYLLQWKLIRISRLQTWSQINEQSLEVWFGLALIDTYSWLYVLIPSKLVAWMSLEKQTKSILNIHLPAVQWVFTASSPWRPLKGQLFFLNKPCCQISAIFLLSISQNHCSYHENEAFILKISFFLV